MNWTGLAATVWDPSGGDRQQHDTEFIKQMVRQNNGPALDVGCGTGRVLLRCLEDGLDVDGLDSSADMLALCRAKAEAKGYAPFLAQQPMQEMDMPRRYQTIFIPCGTFCLLTQREQALEALRRAYRHLGDGGQLIFNLFWVFGDGEPLSANPLGGDNEWGKLWDTDLPDGRLIKQQLKRLKIDRAEQLLTALRRYQLFENDQLVAEEIFHSDERWYFPHEMTLLLEKVGFRSVEIRGGWSEAPFTDQDDNLVFIAQK